MDRLALYELFTRVVDYGSFTRAAARQGVARSVASEAIAGLEQRLGTRLLTRTTRHVGATLEGRQFYERCRRLLLDAEETETLFRRAGGPRGLVRVSVPGRIGRLVIAPRLRDFLGRYPDVNVMLAMEDRAVRLVEEGMDIALRVGTLAESALVARKLGAIDFINVASPAYLAERGTPERPEALDGHAMVQFVASGSERVEPFEWQQGSVLRHRPLPGRVVVDSAEAQIACARAGLGIVQVPRYDVRDDLACGRLVEILPRWRAAALSVHLLFASRALLPGRVSVFAEWLADLVRREVTAAQPSAASEAGGAISS